METKHYSSVARPNSFCLSPLLIPETLLFEIRCLVFHLPIPPLCSGADIKPEYTDPTDTHLHFPFVRRACPDN